MPFFFANRLTRLVLAFAIALFFLTAPQPSLLTAVTAQTESVVTTVYLVRHAEKAATPPDNPPLTEAGQARAQELARVLSQAKIQTIITSQFARTQQTAQPLADRLGVAVTTVRVGMDTMNPRAVSPSSIKEAVDKIHARAGSAALVVGHSNTVPEVIKMLGGDLVPVIDEKEYDDLFIVTVYASGKAKVARLKYGAAR